MPRHHRRKTTRWINEDCMQSAVTDICNGIETPSTAARKYGLKRTTIIYRVERKQKMDLARGKGGPEANLLPQPLLAEIFSAKQEKELMEFLNRYTYLPYDTSSSYKAARQLVYQFVKAHDIKRPKSWDIEKQAGVDWLKGFIQRNPRTNLRIPLADNSKKSDEDDESLSDTDKNLPFATIKINNKTEDDGSPLADIPLKQESNFKKTVSEPSQGSDISHAYSSSHFLESDPHEARNHLRPDSYKDFDEDSEELHLEPECDIIFPVVNIKEESEANTAKPATEDASECKPDFPKLDTNTTPLDEDDVFNSFGRNIAFQVKELYRFNKLDAYELMHEVQSTVNRRLTNSLRLKRLEKNRRRIEMNNKTSAVLSPRVIKIDDDDEIQC